MERLVQKNSFTWEFVGEYDDYTIYDEDDHFECAVKDVPQSPLSRVSLIKGTTLEDVVAGLAEYEGSERFNFMR